jgi:predicted phosphatase
MTDQLDDPVSRIDRIKHGRGETVTKLALVDDLIIYETSNRGLVVEAVRWNEHKRAVESFRFTLCPEDAARIRGARY